MFSSIPLYHLLYCLTRIRKHGANALYVAMNVLCIRLRFVCPQNTHRLTVRTDETHCRVTGINSSLTPKIDSIQVPIVQTHLGNEARSLSKVSD